MSRYCKTPKGRTRSVNVAGGKRAPAKGFKKAKDAGRAAEE